MPWLSKAKWKEFQEAVEHSHQFHEDARAMYRNMLKAANEVQDNLCLDVKEMLKFAAENGITEIELRGLKCKITPKSVLDADKLAQLENQVNKLGLAAATMGGYGLRS